MINTTVRFITDIGPTHVVFAGDARGTSNTRRAVLPEYKAGRKETEPDLRWALDRYPELVTECGWSFISDPVWEADDVIASVARWSREQGHDCYVVTSDKDALPLIDDRVKLIAPDGTRMTPKRVLDKWGVPHTLYTHMAALVGEKSDNIPGVTKVGPKTAAILINKFGDELPLVISDAEKLREAVSEKTARMIADQSGTYLRNLDLIRLRDELPVSEHLEYGDISRADVQRGEKALYELGMNRVVGSYRKSMRGINASPF
jgi:DNA polymerase-1